MLLSYFFCYQWRYSYFFRHLHWLSTLIAYNRWIASLHVSQRLALRHSVRWGSTRAGMQSSLQRAAPIPVSLRRAAPSVRLTISVHGTKHNFIAYRLMFLTPLQQKAVTDNTLYWKIIYRIFNIYMNLFTFTRIWNIQNVQLLLIVWNNYVPKQLRFISEQKTLGKIELNICAWNRKQWFKETLRLIICFIRTCSVMDGPWKVRGNEQATAQMLLPSFPLQESGICNILLMDALTVVTLDVWWRKKTRHAAGMTQPAAFNLGSKLPSYPLILLQWYFLTVFGAIFMITDFKTAYFSYYPYVNMPHWTFYVSSGHYSIEKNNCLHCYFVTLAGKFHSSVFLLLSNGSFKSREHIPLFS